MLDFSCVVGVSMNRAPPLARSGGVGWGWGGVGGGGGRERKEKEEKKKKKTKKKKKKNPLPRKDSIKSDRCNMSHRKKNPVISRKNKNNTSYRPKLQQMLKECILTSMTLFLNTHRHACMHACTRTLFSSYPGCVKMTGGQCKCVVSSL